MDQQVNILKKSVDDIDIDFFMEQKVRMQFHKQA